jgi:hypothetical protein
LKRRKPKGFGGGLGFDEGGVEVEVEEAPSAAVVVVVVVVVDAISPISSLFFVISL